MWIDFTRTYVGACAGAVADAPWISSTISYTAFSISSFAAAWCDDTTGFVFTPKTMSPARPSDGDARAEFPFNMLNRRLLILSYCRRAWSSVLVAAFSSQPSASDDSNRSCVDDEQFRYVFAPVIVSCLYFEWKHDSLGSHQLEQQIREYFPAYRFTQSIKT